MLPVKMYTRSLLTAALLARQVLSYRSEGSMVMSMDPLAGPLVPDYTPGNFIQTYNQTYCPSNTTAIFIPPVFAYYPVSPASVYEIVGSFVNIKWITPAFNDTTFVGQDNVPGGTSNLSFLTMRYFSLTLTK